VNRRAVFLDKDGTLIENVRYNVEPLQVRFTANAIDGVRRLHELGFLLIVVSNQPGVAFGYFDEAALDALGRYLKAMLAAHGVALAGVYCCPHHPQGSVPRYANHCDCRKPAAGLLHRAAAAHGIDLAQSWLIGDILDDVEAGARAGCRTILLDNGNETEWRAGEFRRPDFVVSNVAQAAERIERTLPATLSTREAIH